jgi:hypothetical protein
MGREAIANLFYSGRAWRSHPEHFGDLEIDHRLRQLSPKGIMASVAAFRRPPSRDASQPRSPISGPSALPHGSCPSSTPRYLFFRLDAQVTALPKFTSFQIASLSERMLENRTDTFETNYLASEKLRPSSHPSIAIHAWTESHDPLFLQLYGLPLSR